MARLMTTEEVVDELQLSDDDFDGDEPMMPGSDEFSDQEDTENDSDDDDDTSSTPIAPPTQRSTSAILPS